MAGTAFSVKVSDSFAEEYRAFCDRNCLQVGKFTEAALREVMEDYHFGLKAQRTLATSSGKAVAHAKAFSNTAKR